MDTRTNNNNNNNNNNSKKVLSEIELCPTPEYVAVFDQLPNLGGQEFLLNKKEFAKKVGMVELCESIIFESDNVEESMNVEDEINQFLANEVTAPTLQMLQENINNIGFVYMGEKYGWGAFAREDLPEDEIIVAITGQYSLTTNKINKFSQHSIGIENISIDAQEVG